MEQWELALQLSILADRGCKVDILAIHGVVGDLLPSAFSIFSARIFESVPLPAFICNSFVV